MLIDGERDQFDAVIDEGFWEFDHHLPVGDINELSLDLHNWSP